MYTVHLISIYDKRKKKGLAQNAYIYYDDHGCSNEHVHTVCIPFVSIINLVLYLSVVIIFI